MTSYQQGATVPLIANFYEYAGGPAADVTDLTITITLVAGGTVVVGPTSTGINHPSTGVYTYSWSTSAATTPGDYLVTWTADEGSASESFTITALPTLTAIMGVWYTTREDVMTAPDIKATAYSGRDVDRAIEAGARAAEALLHIHTFAPTYAVRYFDWPGRAVAGVRLYLDEHPLIAVTAISSGGTTIDSADYFLEPVNSGPPYRRIELNRSTGYWTAGSTAQRSIAVTGVWGWTDDSEVAGTTAEALDATETGVDGSGMPTVGVGSVIKVDSERMVVTDKGWLSTAQTGTLTANQNAQVLTVANGSAFVSGETLLLDAERVKVVDIAGNNLTLRRAVDGTTLAAHTSATIYALRMLTVKRGALGTTATTHSSGATVSRWLPPGLLAELNLAYAINHLEQRKSGYARTVGSGENERELAGRGIREIEADAKAALGRQCRIGAV